MIEQWAEATHEVYQNYTGIDSNLPVPIVDIAERIFKLRCDIVDFGNERANIAGILMPRYRRIVANKNSSPNRLAFTIAHEIAHWAVDCAMGGEDHPLNTISTLVSSDGQLREIIADHVAGALLMPRNLLMRLLRSHKIIRIDTVREISNQIGVSYSALRKRIEIVQDEVQSHNISVDWSVERISNPGFDTRQFGEKYWYDGNGWNMRFCPWLPSSQIDLEQHDNLLLFGSFSQIDVRTLQQIRDAKSKVSSLIVAVFDNIDSIDTVTNIPDVDSIAVFSSTHELDQQIAALERKCSCKFKVLTLSSDGWFLSRELPANNYYVDINNWIDYKDSEFAYARTGLSRNNKKQKTPSKPQSVIPSHVVLHTRKEAQQYIRVQKKRGKVVVVATGCFDVFTVAHLHFLKQAKAAGDILVVGVENDNRVTLFKGLLRPVNTIAERIEILDSLEFVDFSFVIRGPTSFNLKPFYTQLYTTLGPNVLAVSEKDSYLEDRRDEIQAANGELSIVQPYEQDISSSSIIQKVIAQHSELPQIWHIAQPLLLAEPSTPKSKFEEKGNDKDDQKKSRYEQLGLPFLQPEIEKDNDNE